MSRGVCAAELLLGICCILFCFVAWQHSNFYFICVLLGVATLLIASQDVNCDHTKNDNA